jgi:tRNA threonylcarbamoyladenosine biosynthesis protein TsaE
MRLGSLLETGDIGCLQGDLGSGKTTLVQGIAQGWGSLDPVTSPTFVIVNVYRRPDQVNLFHVDAYRLQNAAEAEDLDMGLMLEQGAVVIEWPERVIEALPGICLQIKLRWIADEQRGMVFLPQGPRYEALIADFRRRVMGG